MVTLYRPPVYVRRGPALEPYQVVLRPLITEKATHLSERHNAYTFEVARDANKVEIRQAIEDIFKVKVKTVRTANVMAEARRRRRRQPFAPSSSHAMCPSCWPEASWRRG